MQNSCYQGSDCLFSFLQVQGGVPANINLKEFKEDKEDISEIKNKIEMNFRNQKWNIISSEINIDNTLNIIAMAEVEGELLELRSIAILNNDKLYVFELISFAENKYAIDELDHMFNTLKFK